MSTTPPLICQLPRVNKFVGESFGVLSNSRTIYAGSEEDTTKRDTVVILLVGPHTAEKSALIDFFCNYFYGAELENNIRYHIADEKFDKTTPEKEIITYVFNDSVMDVRPVIIDAPSTSGYHGKESRETLSKWLKDNEELKLDVIGVVFSVFHRITADEEEELQKALALFPAHLQKKCAVFMIGSDGSSPPVGLLRRFNLEKSDVYKVNISCIFQRPQDDPLQEHLRGNYWRMSVANFGALFSRLKYEKPVNYSLSNHDMSSDILSNSGTLSTSSRHSFDPIIHRAAGPNIMESHTSSTTTSNIINTTKPIVLHNSLNSPSNILLTSSECRRYDRNEESTEKMYSKSNSYNNTTLPDVSTTHHKEEYPIKRSSLIATKRPHSDAFNSMNSGNSGNIKAELRLRKDEMLHGSDSGEALKSNNDTMKRYLYDISSRSHIPASTVSTISQIIPENMPRISRETTIDDPCYSMANRPHETLTSIRQSWHETSPNHLVKVSTYQNQRKKTPIETVIDFPSPVERSGVLPPRYNDIGCSHQSIGARSRSVEDTQPIREYSSITANNLPKTQKHTEKTIRNGNIDMREIPVFSIRGREEKRKSPQVMVAINGDASRRKHVSKPHSTMNESGGMASMPLYPVAMKPISGGANTLGGSIDIGSVGARNPEETPNRMRNARREYRPNSEPSQYQGNTLSSNSKSDKLHDEYKDRNIHLNSEHISSTNSLITSRVLMNKELNEGPNSTKPYHTSDYGSGLGNEKNTIREVDENQPIPELIEERYRNQHHNTRDIEKNLSQEKISSLPLPPYIENGNGETRPLKTVEDTKVKTKKITTTRPSSTNHPRRVNFLKWTPTNCSNPRDCCLNCLFFFLAPIIVLFIILAVIITHVVL